MSIRHRKSVDQTPVYVPGKRVTDVMKEYGLEKVIKLASNENPFGPSPIAIQAAAEALKEVQRYPDPDSTELRDLIASLHVVTTASVMISNGLEEMIPAICRAYIEEGDESIMPQLSFVKYPIGVSIMAGTCVRVPMDDLEIDLDGILSSITSRTRIIWLCNPNNPTGTYIPLVHLSWFLDSVPDHILVAHDETYRDFTEAKDFPMDTVTLLDRHPNLIILRSFSKAHALAGLRCGYMIADPDIITQVRRVSEVFHVTSVAAAAATASLMDKEHFSNTLRKLFVERQFVRARLLSMHRFGLTFKESQANFYYFETPLSSALIFEELQRRGVIVRPVGPNSIRITIGLHEENRIAMERLYELLERSAQTKDPETTQEL